MAGTIIRDGVISERYRFRTESALPGEAAGLNAYKDYMREVHAKNRYVDIDNCPYCGYTGFTRISEVDARGLPADIVICDSCRGCFKRKILDARAVNYYYADISYELRGKDLSADGIERLFWERVKRFAVPRKNFICHFAGFRAGRDLIMELGCNDGANLYPWHRDGFDVLGVELDEKMVRFGRDKGLNILHGDLSGYSSSGKRPKLVILSHVLEHVSDVGRILDGIFNMIYPDGYLFVEVPGIRSQALRDPLAYFDAEHNYNFDLSSITRLMKQHPFRILYGDEYIRLLATPSRNTDPEPQRAGNQLFRNMALQFLNGAIGLFHVKDADLAQLLKKGDSGALNVRMLSKLRTLYFMTYYSSYKSNGSRR
jgi:SAM-dependent methyltransferase